MLLCVHNYSTLASKMTNETNSVPKCNRYDEAYSSDRTEGINDSLKVASCVSHHNTHDHEFSKQQQKDTSTNVPCFRDAVSLLQYLVPIVWYRKVKKKKDGNKEQYKVQLALLQSKHEEELKQKNTATTLVKGQTEESSEQGTESQSKGGKKKSRSQRRKVM